MKNLCTVGAMTKPSLETWTRLALKSIQLLAALEYKTDCISYEYVHMSDSTTRLISFDKPALCNDIN